jgi:thioester reductase-like protein
MELSERVNVKGTEFVVEMAKKAGATILVYTSSGSVAIRASKYLLWPWQKEPEFFVQALSDGDDITSKPHSHFFSNYAHSKWKAESLVREADGSYNALGQKFKTGCVRPGNGENSTRIE